jgi:release factor glutamine methyltransferase
MKLSSPAKSSQEKKFIERRSTSKALVDVCGEKFVALKNVYDTSTDTELMADIVSIRKDQTFVEIGCGTGAVSLLVGRQAKSGIGVDINSNAVRNAKLNKKRLAIKNVRFLLSDVFDNIKGRFDVVICNPPYSSYKPADEVEMMFWDDRNSMKIKFFNQVKDYLKPEGLVYFGYADFEDIDQNLPKTLAKKAGLKLLKKYSRKYRNGNRMFFVYSFKNIENIG